MTYSKQEQRQVWKRLDKQEQRRVWKRIDKEHYKSIELGFNGNLTTEFYAKLKKVKKVRARLKIELILLVTILIISLHELSKYANKPISGCTANMELPIMQILFLGVFIGMLCLIYKNLGIWLEISKIREKRYNDYYEKHNKRTQ